MYGMKGQSFMESLKRRIEKDGVVIGDSVIKVDSFLNHQMDIAFLKEVGAEFAKRFSDVKVDKILTIEASGIGIAAITAMYFHDVPVVFAKKHQASNLSGDVYETKVYSFTKQKENIIRVDKKYISDGENVLIIDDFLACGSAALGLAEIVEMAGAKVVGIGAVIEKGFQGGHAKLTEKGYRVESLAIIEKIQDGKLIFGE